MSIGGGAHDDFSGGTGQLHGFHHAQIAHISPQGGDDAINDGADPAPVICHGGAKSYGPLHHAGQEGDHEAQHCGQAHGRRFDLRKVLLENVDKIQNCRIDTGPHVFLDVPQGVVELDQLTLRGVAHSLVQPAPALRDYGVDGSGGLHILTHAQVFLAKLRHDLGLGGGALNDGLLGVGELEALFGHGVVGPGHDLAQSGGVIHHGLGVQSAAPAHAHSVVGEGVHHGEDGVGVGEVGGKLRRPGDHGLVAIDARPLDFGGFGKDGVIGCRGLAGVRLHLHTDPASVHARRKGRIGRLCGVCVQG